MRTTLPKLWCVYATKDNVKVLEKYRKTLKPVEKSFKLEPGNYLVNEWYDGSYVSWAIDLPNRKGEYEGYVELTFEEFKALVLDVSKRWRITVTVENREELENWRKTVVKKANRPDVTCLIDESLGRWLVSDWYDGTFLAYAMSGESTKEYPEISLEEFRRLVSKVEPFVLPEKWCIKSGDRAVVDYCNMYGSIPKYTKSQCAQYYCHFPAWNRCTTVNHIVKGYTEISLEQFKEYVMKKEEGLPKEWCLAVTAENLQEVENWRTCGAIGHPRGYVLSRGCSKALDKEADGWHTSEKPKGVPEITFEQFKKYVLNKKEGMNTIIGYNLKKFIDGEAVARELGTHARPTSSGVWMPAYGGVYDKAVRLGILDTCFEPVFETIPDITIKGYKAEFTEDGVRFGCQAYTKEFVIQLADTLEKNSFNMDYSKEIRTLAAYLKKNK